jgi:transglutaminase-like putative cysteine protease
MKCVLTTAVALVLIISSYSNDLRDVPKYPVNQIPEALRKNVKAVVREDEVIFKILSQKSATVHIHYAVTILTTNGADFASSQISYDKMRKIKDLRAVAYDADGKVIEKLKSGDFIDQAAFDGSSLFSDSRVKTFDLTQSTLPYTVEVEYDIDYSMLFTIDGSSITSQENVSVQHFVYELVYPAALKPRIKTYNITAQPVVSSPSGGTESTRWTLDNVMPLVIEPMASPNDFVPRIAAAPNNFEVQGYAGDLSTWEGYGKWQLALNEGRDVLPDATKAKVKELTKNLKTNEEKAKVLYEYMQSKTRYVGIQLGIGGWQPFEASVVDKNGYGDCKALSNYMVSLLKEAGIKGYYTKIRAGYGEDIDATFPSVQTNHIIVAVPNEKDTLWLECTSQTAPFGYLGTFTGNRHALMVTENGGKIVRTRYYPQTVNVQSTTAEVDLDMNGNAKAHVKTDYSGLQYENQNLDYVVNLSTEEQKKWIQKNTNIPTFDVAKFSIANKKEKIPTATVKADLILNKYASVSNKRIFVTPNLMNRSSFIPEKVANRKTSFTFITSFTDIDTIRYNIPEGIYPEFLPPDARYESRFGIYEAGFKLDAGSLIYVRKFVRKDGQFPPESYPELIDFYKNINKADNAKLVFLNKT